MPHSKDVICLNSAQDTIVPCDSPEAAFRLVGAGGEVSDEDVKKYNLKKLGLLADEPEAPAEVEAAPEEKAQPVAPANKAVPAAQNKGAVKK